jgi:hypothetical protein
MITFHTFPLESSVLYKFEFKQTIISVYILFRCRCKLIQTLTIMRTSSLTTQQTTSDLFNF